MVLLGAAILSGAGIRPALAADANVIKNDLYMPIGDFDEKAKPLLTRPDVDGVQVLVTWKMLEPQKDKYDFSAIDHVLDELAPLGKELFVQVQDRWFQLPAKLPKYLLTGAEYAGGFAETINENGLGSGPPGAAAAQWNPAVRDRFQQLLAALAQRFDGRLAGVNLPESALKINTEKDKTGFTCDAYFFATLDNAEYGRKVFTKSAFVQYVNFWPCEWQNDHGYTERAFAFAKQHGIGLGGPDVLPNRPAQMANSYPFFSEYRGQLTDVSFAIQEPDFKYTNPETGKPYTREEFVQFATDRLGARRIFWATSAPWLHHEQPNPSPSLRIPNQRLLPVATPSEVLPRVAG